MLHQPPTSNQTDAILYLSFRAAFVTTFDRLISDFHTDTVSSDKIFLERIPLASGCAPQVQLDLLLQTWNRISEFDPGQLSIVDQCVCYCATAELASFGETENQRYLERSSNGPKEMSKVDILWLASKLRTIQITWPFPVDCAMLLRDANFLNADLDQSHEQSLPRNAAVEMLEVVGSWMVTPTILSNAEGLLTEAEIRELGCFLQKHPRLMNL